jgi:hypothetical protein
MFAPASRDMMHRLSPTLITYAVSLIIITTHAQEPDLSGPTCYPGIACCALLYATSTKFKKLFSHSLKPAQIASCGYWGKSSF